jgi:hypothetical protein
MLGVGTDRRPASIFCTDTQTMDATVESEKTLDAVSVMLARSRPTATISVPDRHVLSTFEWTPHSGESQMNADRRCRCRR